MAKLGRPGIPPGVYFRMLVVGDFEGLDSQRAIAWRGHDSRSLQAFLGYSITNPTPDHSSLTNIRQRLPMAIHEQVFAKVLAIAQTKQLLKGRATAVDSALIEAEADMYKNPRRVRGKSGKQVDRLRSTPSIGLRTRGSDALREKKSSSSGC